MKPFDVMWWSNGNASLYRRRDRSIVGSAKSSRLREVLLRYFRLVPGVGYVPRKAGEK